MEKVECEEKLERMTMAAAELELALHAREVHELTAAEQMYLQKKGIIENWGGVTAFCEKHGLYHKGDKYKTEDCPYCSWEDYTEIKSATS